MKILFLLSIVLANSSLSFCQKIQDSTDLVNLLINDYQTMENFNLAGHIRNCTPDYLLIENGEVWDLERESRYFRENAHRKIVRKNTFHFDKVYSGGVHGYAVYTLYSEIIENGKSTTYLWAESAVFRKLSGKWKIAVIHSTKIR